jgi:hypothetical protein
MSPVFLRGDSSKYAAPSLSQPLSWPTPARSWTRSPLFLVPPERPRPPQAPGKPHKALGTRYKNRDTQAPRGPVPRRPRHTIRPPDFSDPLFFFWSFFLVLILQVWPPQQWPRLLLPSPPFFALYSCSRLDATARFCEITTCSVLRAPWVAKVSVASPLVLPFTQTM